MSAADVSTGIADLEALRVRVAELNHRLGARELESRVLRFELEGALVQQGTTKTEAEKRAKVDARYLAFERATLGLAEERDKLLAWAEAGRFRVQLELGYPNA